MLTLDRSFSVEMGRCVIALLICSSLLMNLRNFYWCSVLDNWLQGCVYSVSMNSHTGVLSRSHRHRSSSRQKSPVTTVEYRSFSLLARGPVLLTCTQDGSLSFFRFGRKIWLLFCFKIFTLFSFFTDKMIVCHSVALEIQGYLTLRCSLKLTPRIYNIRASFCPLLSLEKGEYIGVHVCLSFVHLSVSKKAIFFFSLCVLLRFFLECAFLTGTCTVS